MRSVILSIEKRFTYILDESGSFRKIYRRDSHTVGGEIEISAPRSGGSRRSRIRMISAIAACFVVMIGGYVFADKWDSAAYSLYIDINPSIKLDVNGFNQVITQQPLNSDGVDLLNKAKPNGSVISAIGDVVSEAVSSNYVTDDGVTITVIGGDSVRMEKLTSVVETAFETVGIKFVYATEAEEAFALEHGATPYKFDLAKRAYEKCEGLPLETAVLLPAGYLEDLLSGDEVWVRA